MADTRRCEKTTRMGKPCPIFPMYRRPSDGAWFCHVHANRNKCDHADGRPRPGMKITPKTLPMTVSPDQERLIREEACGMGVQPWAVLRACIALGLRRDDGPGLDLVIATEEALRFPGRMPAPSNATPNVIARGVKT